LKAWRRVAKADRIALGQFIRDEMAAAVERHRRVGVAMGLGSARRMGGREPRSSPVKGKRGT
jgi:hypothetical protein